MLILVRHGRTEANASGLLLGRLDPVLDEVGRGQAEAVAAAVAAAPGWNIGRVISSPLQRTRETAVAIAEPFGLPVELDDQWIELDYGELDGVPLASIAPEMWSRWRRDPSFAPPGGESLLDLGRRVRPALDALAGEARAADIVVVSHVSPIKAAVTWALGADDSVTWRMFLAPASITVIAVADRGPALHAFNVTTHL